jgi:hypothetical protein
MDDQHHADAEAPPVNRFLVALVYGMGVLLVLMFLGLIGGIVWKFKQRAALPQTTDNVALGLPAAAQIRDAHLTGDKLTINTGTEVFVVEVSTGRILLRVRSTQN